MQTTLLVLSLLLSGVHSLPANQEPQLVGRATPKASVQYLGTTTSNFPNIYRDGGGGGTINGLNFIWFSDGLYTSGGVPGTSNVVNFTSNSIACSNCNGGGITSLSDFGTTAKGPFQQIPYFYSNGESDGKTGVWPNQNLVTLCSGGCAVGFPVVVNRTAIAAGLTGDLYNTGVEFVETGFGPVASRPTQSLFIAGEPLFGTFSAFAGVDGYLYTFAHVSQTSTSNGIKMARVPQGSWSSRSQYQYWSGTAWTTQIPTYDDGGKANIFSYSQTAINGVKYGPGTGDLFYSNFYGVYMLIFQPDDAALDNNVYMSYSSSLTSGWSTPQSIYTIPTLSSGYSYSLHAYPNYDSTGKVVPLSWSEYASPSTYIIAMANITFS